MTGRLRNKRRRRPEDVMTNGVLALAMLAIAYGVFAIALHLPGTLA